MTGKIRFVLLTSAAIAVASVLVAAPVVAAVCVNPSKSKCEATIQAGVDAASAGDTVSVAAGLYLENVVIPAGKDGLRLKGSKKTILDGDDPNAGVALTVQSNDVSVEGFAIHNGQTDAILVDVGVSGTQIRKMSIRGPSESCIEMADNTPNVRIESNFLHACSSDSIVSSNLTANNLVIRQNKFVSCGNDCIEVFGDNIIVEKNSFESTDGDFIVITGNNAEVVGNSLRSGDDGGIDITGDDALVAKNAITAVGDEGIQVSGNNANVTKNKISSIADDDAIDVSGTNPVITGNTIDGIPDYGIDVNCTACTGGMVTKNRMSDVGYDDESGFDIDADAAGLVVEKNVVTGTVDTGMDVGGTGVVVRNNRVENGGGDSNDEAVDVSGADHVLSGNTVANWQGTGIRVNGTGITLDRNKSFGHSRDGIRVTSTAVDATLTDNDVRNNAETGIAIRLGATGTTATGNKASDNTRVDLCDEGTGSTLSDNDAATTQLNTGFECPID